MVCQFIFYPRHTSLLLFIVCIKAFLMLEFDSLHVTGIVQHCLVTSLSSRCSYVKYSTRVQ